MKAKPFRLEPVLRIRRIEEKTAALAAADAERVAREAESTAVVLEAAATTALVPTSGAGGAFIAAMAQTRRLAVDAAAATAHAAVRREQAAEARGEWTVAAQRTKGLERMRERHLSAVQQAADRAEVRMVDDLVTRAHAVRPPAQGQM